MLEPNSVPLEMFISSVAECIMQIPRGGGDQSYALPDLGWFHRLSGPAEVALVERMQCLRNVLSASASVGDRMRPDGIAVDRTMSMMPDDNPTWLPNGFVARHGTLAKALNTKPHGASGDWRRRYLLSNMLYLRCASMVEGWDWVRRVSPVLRQFEFAYWAYELDTPSAPSDECGLSSLELDLFSCDVGTALTAAYFRLLAAFSDGSAGSE